MKGIFLISTVMEDKSRIAWELLNYPGVQAAYPVYGAFDIVAVVDVEDLPSFQKLLHDKVNGVDLITALVPDSTDYGTGIEMKSLYREWGVA